MSGRLFHFRSLALLARRFASHWRALSSTSHSLPEKPSLKDFLKPSTTTPYIMSWKNVDDPQPAYLDAAALNGNGLRVYIKTYGCQMNVNDSQIASSLLEASGYELVDTASNADIVLLMTCAIREGAENKVWVRLKELAKEKQAGRLRHFGLLGCMAERLKTKVLDKIPAIDVIAGPDAYRALPRLLAISKVNGQQAVNVMLSLEETYSEVMPRRSAEVSTSAFVSITRGCNNMCSYCIVPYTRGQERSRQIDSILEEVEDCRRQGFKEIILLGQNVNSYFDQNEASVARYLTTKNNEEIQSTQTIADGFNTIYKTRTKLQAASGIGFDVLLKQVARSVPDMRIRFTSPHPKDFTDSVLEVIASHDNIAKGLHLPAQSGSDSVLEKMRRGYTKESYLQLIEKIKALMPNCGLSSDFICGFCGEKDNDHRETVDLVRRVGYRIAYIFAYSRRPKTAAYHRMIDDVPESVKIERVIELNQVYRDLTHQLNREEIGRQQLLLLEGESKKSSDYLYGRNEANQKVVVPKGDWMVGDFVEAKIVDCTPVTLIGQVMGNTTIKQFYSN